MLGVSWSEKCAAFTVSLDKDLEDCENCILKEDLWVTTCAKLCQWLMPILVSGRRILARGSPGTLERFGEELFTRSARGAVHRTRDVDILQPRLGIRIQLLHKLHKAAFKAFLK